jgi:hypothetical protein
MIPGEKPYAAAVPLMPPLEQSAPR